MGLGGGDMIVRQIRVPWKVPKGYDHVFRLIGSGGSRVEIRMAGRDRMEILVDGEMDGVERSASFDWEREVVMELKEAAGAL